MRLIDYGHERNGVLYHGTLSDAEGPPRSTWTYEENGEKVTVEHPIDVEAFEVLWAGITHFEVFQRCRVENPDVPINPATHHVIGARFDNDGEPGQALFLVPNDELDPQFLIWSMTLNVPDEDGEDLEDIESADWVKDEPSHRSDRKPWWKFW